MTTPETPPAGPLGERLRAVRLAEGFTQVELAEAVCEQQGPHRPGQKDVSHWEGQAAWREIEKIAAIAAVYGLRPSDLLRRMGL